MLCILLEAWLLPPVMFLVAYALDWIEDALGNL